MPTVLRRATLGSVLYVLVGYPLVAVAASQLRRGRRPHPGEGSPTGDPATAPLPSVSLVVAAWNEEDVIEDKLRNSVSLDAPPELVQVIVAADGSTDRTVERAERFDDDRVIVSFAPGRDGKVAALNRAVPLATGEIVVFSDANNLYRRQTLRRLVEPFADPSVGAVSGAKVTTSGPDDLQSGEGLYWRYETMIKRAEDRLGSCTSASGEVLAVRRDLLAPLPVDVGLDDFVRMLTILRSGHRVAFAPEAVSVETTTASLAEEEARRTRNTAMRWRLLARPGLFPLRRPLVMWQIGSHKVGRLLLPFLAVAALFANLAEVVLAPPRSSRRPLGILGLQLLFYGAGLLDPDRVPVIGRRAGRALSVPRYVVRTNVATVRGLVVAMRQPNDDQWAKPRRHGG